MQSNAMHCTFLTALNIFNCTEHFKLHWTFLNALNILNCTELVVLHWTFLHCVHFIALCSLYHCCLDCIALPLQQGCEFWRPSAYSKSWRWELGSLKSKIQVGTTSPWKLKWELDVRRPRLKTKSPKIGQRHPGRFPGSFNLWPLSTIPTTLVDVLMYTFLLFKNWDFQRAISYKLARLDFSFMGGYQNSDTKKECIKR